MKLLSSFILLLFITFSSIAQSYSEAIIGNWKSEDGKTIVEIYKKNNIYYGRIIWMQNPLDSKSGQPRTDIENPDSSLRNRPLMNLLVLMDLKFLDGFWQDGIIYNSQTGKYYNCDVWMENNETLVLKIYWMLSSQTQKWTREK